MCYFMAEVITRVLTQQSEPLRLQLSPKSNLDSAARRDQARPGQGARDERRKKEGISPLLLHVKWIRGVVFVRLDRLGADS